ncbi:TonB-dependent receptor [Paraurantiacibacter namhicola]|uniref:Cna protein B-type domain protein n=1 Tax=Paraurantiacibacter namhicola TaxID=645517 RepID=A0A1C7D5S4_9SPHN|nr:carboxypeptidase regulatory-like domain-containing protein [Paraurantiacibacter namhicola]ANU06810.1 Cna protein B-type domain protein [Paraurantiacibacter namhicola]
MKSFLKKSALKSASCLQALSIVGVGAGMVAVAAPAAAQDYTRGVLQGTVVDEAGNPVAGAEVTVTSNAQGFSNSTTTSANGGFTVNALPTGNYTVVVSQNGTPLVEDRGARVVAGQTNNYRYIATGEAVAVADGGNEIVVLGIRTQTVDFSATQTGITLDVEDLAENIPVSRNANDLILLAPGTTAGDGGFGSLVSIGGATVAENAYYVNGLNITDFRNFLGGSIIPFEFYQTLDVKTGGYQAEYGRALGGVTSATTKSGSNEFEFGVVATYNPNWGRSTSPNTFQDNPLIAGDDVLSLNDDDFSESYDASLYASGPIIKDRLFFYALYQPRYFKSAGTSAGVSTGTAPSGQRLTTTSDSPFFGGKLDFVIADGHRLEGTYFRDDQTQETEYAIYDARGGAGLTGGILGNVVNTFGGDNFIVTYTGSFTDWFTLSLSYGENHDKSTQVADPNVSSAITRLGTTRQAYGTVTGDVNDLNDRIFYRADADVYVDFLGEHHFRFGFDYEDLTASETTRYTGSGYRYDFRSRFALAYRYFNEGSFNTDMRAFYIQDDWSLFDGRLNLQLGLRNDRFRNYTQNGELYYDSGDQWGPRIGAAFDVFGDGRTKLTGFWGRYFLPIATNTNIRLAGSESYYLLLDFYGSAPDVDGDGIPDFYTVGADGEVTNFGTSPNSFLFGSATCPAGTPDAGRVCRAVFADGTLGPTDTLVNASLQPSYTDEFIIGVEHKIDDWTFGVNYINRRLGETLEDVAIDAAVIAYCAANGIAGCPTEWTGFHQYVLTNPGKDMTVRLDGDCSIAGQCDVVTLTAAQLGYPEAIRDYDAVEFVVDKSFDGLYGFNFSYVWTKLEGNFEGAVKSDNNQSDAGLTQDFDQPGFLDGAFGPLANEREHSFKFYGHIQPLEWLDISTNVVVQSPRKFSCIGNYQNDSSAFEYSYGAASFYCRQPEFGGDPSQPIGNGQGSVLVPRSSAFESDWNKRVDLGVRFDLLPLRNIGNSYFRVDIFNVFNWQSKLDFNEFGDIGFGGINPNYKKVRGYQAPRSVRFTLALRYGGD